MIECCSKPGEAKLNAIAIASVLFLIVMSAEMVNFVRPICILICIHSFRVTTQPFAAFIPLITSTR